jgi:hypothetical protein
MLSLIQLVFFFTKRGSKPQKQKKLNEHSEACKRRKNHKKWDFVTLEEDTQKYANQKSSRLDWSSASLINQQICFLFAKYG